MNEVADLLRHAANVVEERGLAKHDLVDEADRVCVMGALNVAHHGSPYYPMGDSFLNTAGPSGLNAVLALGRVISVEEEELSPFYQGMRDHAPSDYADATDAAVRVVTWNNREGTTQEEVVVALREAAQMVAASGN